MQLSRVLAGALFARAAYAAVVSIDVGEDGLVMSPKNVKANVGDVVQFTFYPPQHTVVQAAFDKPCEPLSGGFYSGVMSVSGAKSDKVFQINITNTDPIWYYCSIDSHCKTGMVGVINPPSSGNSIDDFANAAKNAQVVKPSSNGPDGGTLVSPGGNSGNSSASGNTSATGSPTGGSSASASAQASSTSKAAAAAITEHAGLILPVVFAAAGLVL
ncbi:hypothetical protein GP486_000345 [Trichoglossum hirsutum]|uniref:Phytocyanin domain-containing protein n=1 Tax=Trichoglossum hirsutum TaxID=265104 RepID=A0A9P8LJ23_9PEZI|nr:hypothetical protein GP486_000345 [Trichoglossum hirsutum]